MYDIFHEWGSDLVVGSGGDLALAYRLRRGQSTRLPEATHQSG